MNFLVRLVLSLLLLVLPVQSASSSPTVSTLAPTGTSCPRLFATHVSPPPASFVCGGQGELSKPDVLNTYCISENTHIGLGNYYDDPTMCYRACVHDARCVSYGLDLINRVCYTYGKALIDMGYKQTTHTIQFFYNLRGCFVCNQPPYDTSGCPSVAKPKPTPQPNYTCGHELAYPDEDNNIYYIYQGDLTLQSCYDICVSYFDAVGQCISFTRRDDPQQGTSCFFYNRSLIENHFKYDSGTYLRGYNLRGCFYCNESGSTVQDCVPRRPPATAGVRDGNFTETEYNTLFNVTGPLEWTYNRLISVKKLDNGNNVSVIMGNSYGVNQNNNGALSQKFFGIPTGTGIYYNLTFDLAVVQASPSDYRPNLFCELQVHDATDRYGGIYINATDASFQGSTLKPLGPLRVSAVNGAPAVIFETQCASDGSGTVRATYYMRNVKLFRNGQIYY